MKIGILTQPLANNYGGILQNFALQTTLRRLGHSVITINIPQDMRICQGLQKFPLDKEFYKGKLLDMLV